MVIVLKLKSSHVLIKMEVDGWRRCFLLSLTSLLLRPQQTQTINDNDGDGINNGSLTFTFHSSVTPLSSTVPMTTADDADSETNNCDGVVLVDHHSFRTHIKNRVKDFIRCSGNNTVSRCIITFTGRSKFIMETHQLCYDVPMIDFYRYESKSRQKITMASGVHRREYKTWARGLYLHDGGFCASQSEDLLMTYETDDNFCTPGFKHGFVGQVTVMQRPYFDNTIDLVRNGSCYQGATSRLQSSILTGTIVSSYEPEWSERLSFCKGTIRTSYDTVRLCFRSTLFRTYSGGAYLTITSGKNKLLFDHYNPLKKECIAVKYERVSIQVMQGKGTRKFDHAFLIFYNTVKGRSDDSSNDMYNDDHSDYKDLTSSWWFIFLVMCGIMMCCTCCFYRCCKRKKAAPSYEASVALRNDEPTNHPAFSSAPRFTRPPTSTMLPQRPSGGNDSRTTEEIRMTLLESVPVADQAMPKRDIDGLPTYESLFPGGNKL